MRTLVCAVGLLLVAACGSAGRVATVAPTSPDELPSALREFVEDQWPGARVAAAVPAGSCAGAPATPSLAIAPGDFNGDGLGDLVVRVVAGDAVHLVAAIAHGTEYVFHMAPIDGDLASGPLVIGPRGAAFLAASGIADYFGNDTPVVLCGTSTTAFFWTGAGLDPRRIGL